MTTKWWLRQRHVRMYRDLDERRERIRKLNWNAPAWVWPPSVGVTERHNEYLARSAGKHPELLNGQRNAKNALP